MKIRQAEIKDIDTLIELWTSFMSEHEQLVISRQPALSQFERKSENKETAYREYLESCLESSVGTSFVAVDEDSGIVGYTLLVVGDEIPIFQNKKVGVISDLYVRSDSRGNGVGTALIEHSVDWFKQRDIFVLSVPLYSANREAYEAYLKWGFQDYKLEMRRDLTAV